MIGSYEKNVFINCPFDEEYSPLFRAMIFTIYDCGFTARCALEKSDSSEVRISKIYDLIAECKLGIHDLSRTALSEDSGLPRFNMPLELGIFLGAKFLGQDENHQKMCLIFDHHPYRYQKYLSDIAGQDINSHNKDLETFISKIRNWLAEFSESIIPSGSVIFNRYTIFQKDLISYCKESKHTIEEITYNDYLMHISKFAANKNDILKTGKEMRWGLELENPSLIHIRESIELLIDEFDSFVILSRSNYSYIQCQGEKSEGYILEFQDGSLDEHYICGDGLNEEDVVKIFQAYRKGDESWKTDYKWIKKMFI